MSDPTEDLRRNLVTEINSQPGERAELEARYGRVWNTEELTRDFSVQGFLAPFVTVTRKADGKKGLMSFQHRPRYYFCFEETA
jgi:hypothetical protein